MMNSNTMNKSNANANMLDGFERWFFGGDPGPEDGSAAFELTVEPTPLSIDQNDALIPAFSHRCDCGQHASLVACLRKAAPPTSHPEAQALAPLHF